jgi:hypothetical protein
MLQGNFVKIFNSTQTFKNVFCLKIWININNRLKWCAYGGRQKSISRAPRWTELVWQCGILNISQPYRPPRPVTGIALLYFLFFFDSWVVCSVGCTKRNSWFDSWRRQKIPFLWDAHTGSRYIADKSVSALCWAFLPCLSKDRQCSYLQGQICPLPSVINVQRTLQFVLRSYAVHCNPDDSGRAVWGMNYLLPLQHRNRGLESQ